jgi:hypothetical protein
MTNQRLQTRSICADLVYLDWKDPSGACECAAVLEDISPRGACLQAEIPVPIDIEGIIRHGEHWSAECRIKYCVFREIGYFVGVEFIDSDAWLKHEFLPEHLLDLGDLVHGSD